MSTSRDDRYYGTHAKSRRSPPGGDAQSSGFFQTGQGGRTVLPPLSSAFPSSRFPVPNTYSIPYTQPRSSPQRADFNPSSLYGHWPNGAPTAAPQPSPSFYYEHHDPRYTAQPNYAPFPSRASPAIPTGDPRDSRKLAPLHLSQPAGREDRWTTSQYPAAPHLSSSGYIRSPTASYPESYAAYPGTGQSNAYSYQSVSMPDARGHSHVSPMDPRSQPAGFETMVPMRTEHRRSPMQVTPPAYASQPPTSQQQSEETIIKKKRKRADAAQLKVLNETYARTAFPSTEERAEMAKKLDMSARSVQIWFQNKRQSMRQTNRQSTVSSNSHQPFSMTPQSEALMDEMPHGGYGHGSAMPMAGPSYVTRSTQEIPRSQIGHSSQSPPTQRRPRSQEDNVKWSSQGY